MCCVTGLLFTVWEGGIDLWVLLIPLLEQIVTDAWHGAELPVAAGLELFALFDHLDILALGGLWHPVIVGVRLALPMLA